MGLAKAWLKLRLLYQKEKSGLKKEFCQKTNQKDFESKKYEILVASKKHFDVMAIDR